MPFSRLFALVLLAGAALAAAWGAWRLGQPVPVPDPASPRIACLSYSPFRQPGESPFDPKFVMPEDRIEADLKLLAKRTGCVRTYSIAKGLDAVPRVAERLGVKVMLGIWIGRLDSDNQREIARAVEVAKAHPQTVTAVIVGNEVLLRGEQPESALAGYLTQVRNAVPQPVTYADVWEFWLRHAKLAESASFVTVHILPYWEDHPIPVDQAVAHVLSIHDHVKTRFAGKDILIGETGWPSVGRDRQGAIPSRENAARFVRGVVSAANERGIRYNIVEAFDQPWKRILEGAVGGYWGIYASDGTERFPETGPIVEEPRWVWGVIAGGVAALLFAAAALLQRSRFAGSLALALLGFAAGVAAAAQWRVLALTARGPFEWWVGGIFGVIALGGTLVAALALARWFDGREAPLPSALADTTSLRHLDTLTGLARFALLFGAAANSLLLAFDSRYRDFPLEWAVVPALAYGLLALVTRANPARALADDAEERLMALLIALAAPAIVIIEQPSNLHALAWVAASLVLAAASVAAPFKSK